MPYLKDRYLRTVLQRTEEIGNQVYHPIAPLSMTCFCSDEPLSFDERYQGKRVTIHEGEIWGKKLFDCAWFHFEGVIPPECDEKEVIMMIDVNGEGLIVDAQGEPVQGITCVDSEFDYSLGYPGKQIWLYAKKGKAGEKIDFWMDAGFNDLFGHLPNEGRVRIARVGWRDKLAFDTYYNLAVLTDYLRCSDEKSARYNQILFSLYDACLQNELQIIHDISHSLVSKKGGDAPLHFTAIGHAHMDLAWKWPIRETKRKGARTFSTVLTLMDKYPDYYFGASQPQLYQWMKEDYPGLYQRIKDKVREGHIEPQGCMWVEADTNLSGGEALVRQILYGKQFFKEEFGKDIRVLWLPDVFGYNAALPQILKLSGNDVFMTQKLSWSQHNKFPHQTFMWRGIDGTEIFTHMLPEETYNSPILPRSLRFAEQNYAENGICDEALLLFGIGDGGGGPGMEHLEAAKRVNNFYGLCPVQQAPAQEMLLRMKDKFGHRVPVWQGELYLERHQGTYTTSARSKKQNRKTELKLRELEFFCAISGQNCREEMETLWKEALLYQFHDILPGSSIQRVYDESLARYDIMHKQMNALIKERGNALANGRTFFNSLSWPRRYAYEEHGAWFEVTIPAMGYTNAAGEKIDLSELKADNGVLENKHIRACFDAVGRLCSLYDKINQRECLAAPSGELNVWEEHNADCWDIAIEYTDRKPDAFVLDRQSFSIQGNRAVCRQYYSYGKSTACIDISLAAGNDVLEYDAQVDWQESDQMLRTAFHTLVVSDHAKFDIQYGFIRRPNHENTLWDKAKFEVCGHKWVDISESNWGVALLNDCKYGFRVRDGSIDMNILRAQHQPSDLTDRGVHTLRYGLYPHSGDISDNLVMRKAYEFNVPAECFESGDKTSELEASLLQAQGVIAEAIKYAEDGNGLILRLFEPSGCRREIQVDFGQMYKITPVDLLENQTSLSFEGNKIVQWVRPFEILSFRLEKVSN